MALIPRVALNFSTPPRSHQLQPISHATPEHQSSAAKSLTFSAASLISTPPKFNLSSLMDTQRGAAGTDITPNKTPSTPMSVLATPESIAVSSPDASGLNMSMDKLTDSGKRGRPRADLITSLIQEGTSSPSGIKCSICGRVFPREKSLQAHIRTHTGEKPYSCDYPGCTKSFRQSGQLKTHQRLHAGERPFACAAPG